jgi:pyridoxal phosphate enzyme (YggS family)
VALVTDTRRQEIARRLDEVRARIARACQDAGRSPEEVTLVVVTKFFPASDVRHLADLGVHHVAENRHQEGAAKRDECSDLGLTWHFVGGLQSNKAAAVGAWADVVQSVDRTRLLGGLARAAHERGRPLDVAVQVSLDPPDDRGARAGAAPDQLDELVARILETEDLTLRGVMAVAPLGADPDEAFSRLAGLAARVRASAPRATWLSAGMSTDLEHAVRHGATHVRVGSAVLGNRPPRR